MLRSRAVSLVGVVLAFVSGVAAAADEKTAKISWNVKTKTIEIENFSALPIDLINVKSKTP